MFSENKKKLLHYLILATLIVVIDRLTKSWALTLVHEKIVNPFFLLALHSIVVLIGEYLIHLIP